MPDYKGKDLDKSLNQRARKRTEEGGKKTKKAKETTKARKHSKVQRPSGLGGDLSERQKRRESMGAIRQVARRPRSKKRGGN